MSHFEYISVAIALMNTLLVGRLLNGLSPSLSHDVRYPTHAAWVVTLILVSVLQWWVLWRTNAVVWNPIRFLWALTLPAVLFVRAGVLLGDHPEQIASFRDHFFQHRVPFFSLGLASAVMVIFSPWVFGVVPWFAAAAAHPSGALLATISVAGLVFKGAKAHAVIVMLSMFLAASSFILVPVVG